MSKEFKGLSLILCYSWLSEWLDFTQMVMVIQKELKIFLLITLKNFYLCNFALKSPPWVALDPALLLAVRVDGLHPDGHGHLETTDNNSNYHP